MASTRAGTATIAFASRDGEVATSGVCRSKRMRARSPENRARSRGTPPEELPHQSVATTAARSCSFRPGPDTPRSGPMDLNTGQDTQLTASREEKYEPELSRRMARSCRSVTYKPADGPALHHVGGRRRRRTGLGRRRQAIAWSPDGKYSVRELRRRTADSDRRRRAADDRPAGDQRKVVRRTRRARVRARRPDDLVLRGEPVVSGTVSGRGHGSGEARGPRCRKTHSASCHRTERCRTTSRHRDGFYCVWAQRVDRVTKRPVGDPRPIYHSHVGPRVSITSLAYRPRPDGLHVGRSDEQHLDGDLERRLVGSAGAAADRPNAGRPTCRSSRAVTRPRVFAHPRAPRRCMRRSVRSWAWTSTPRSANRVIQCA